MVTENGLPPSSQIRSYINRLQRRLDYISDCIAEDYDEGCKPNSYDVAEADALRWAIPVLEAEWDNSARLNENLRPIAQRLGSLERHGSGDDRKPAPPWIYPQASNS